MLTWLKKVLRRDGKGQTPLSTNFRRLPFLHELVPGTTALADRNARLHRGAIPILMGEPYDIELLLEILDESEESTEQILAQAAELDVEAWLEQRLNDDPDQFSIAQAPWPDVQPAPIELGVHLDVLSRKPKSEVILAAVPACYAWEVPAYLRIGGWNDCPPSAVHVAIHKRWHERFGAEIACITSDVIECTVARPPATRDEALQLAREQFLYCPDIVNQGVEAVENLAATLMVSPCWYFWWD